MNTDTKKANFNSTIVRLIEFSKYIPYLHILHFNSTIVRLIAVNTGIAVISYSAFYTSATYIFLLKKLSICNDRKIPELRQLCLLSDIQYVKDLLKLKTIKVTAEKQVST